VKVTPANQTLILASDRRGAANKPATALGKTPATGGSVLQRVTIVAARPDDTLIYVSADYAQALGVAGTQTAAYAGRTYAAPGGASRSNAVAAVAPTSSSARDNFGNLVSRNLGSTLTSYLKPAEQYARTQRMLSDVPRVQQIDVYA